MRAPNCATGPREVTIILALRVKSGQSGSGGVKWAGDVAGAGAFRWGECISLEVWRLGVHAAAGDAVYRAMDAVAGGFRDGDFD